MADTDFKVENLRVKNLPPIAPAAAIPRQAKRELAIVTKSQQERLWKAHFAAERVFLHLYALTWRKRQPVKLANAALKQMGICRNLKLRVLRELEALGLIAVEWRSKKSPIITVLYE
jgi:hypothetical protein